ncbi:uncharacterized protein LOC129748380 [Uranotaenia lowii]|uniref:uncharacterized protein LOC129748380 n=1 Tax=Uranotaenia lowii TaxID=190385 RepID=UPI002478EF49|nr:uncharacterized protein LOC129748380 [Uranotaenia lowii]
MALVLKLSIFVLTIAQVLSYYPKIREILEESEVDSNGRIGTVTLEDRSWTVNTTLEAALRLLEVGFGTQILTSECAVRIKECYWPPRVANPMDQLRPLGVEKIGAKTEKPIYDLENYEEYLEQLKKGKELFK